MLVKISIEQTVDTDDYGFYDDMSDEDRVVYLVDRFAEDINTLVKNKDVMDNMTVTYLTPTQVVKIDSNPYN